MAAAAERYYELRETEPTLWIFGFEELGFVREAPACQDRHDDASEVAALSAGFTCDMGAAHTRLG